MKVVSSDVWKYASACRSFSFYDTELVKVVTSLDLFRNNNLAHVAVDDCYSSRKKERS